jgi:hypothetical protein
MLAEGTGGNGSTEPSVGAAVSGGAAFDTDTHDANANTAGMIHRVILGFLVNNRSPATARG